MNLEYVTPDLRQLDVVKSDAMCLCLYEEDWPLRGTPGLVDWRVCGHLSRQRESGWITCKPGEVVLIPLSPRLPCDKLLLIGMGSMEDGLTSARVAGGLHRMFETLEKLKISAAVLHLPGRPDHMPAEEVAEILLSVAEEHPDHDEITLVEPAEAQLAIQRVVESWMSATAE